MKIVVAVERYAPAVGGAERVAQRIAEGLASRGHEITVLTTGRRSSIRANGVLVERFPVRGNLAVGIRGPAAEARRFIEEHHPDLVFTYAAQTWTADIFAVSLYDDRRPFALVHAPCGFSALKDPGYKSYFDRVRAWLPRYDYLIFHSAIYQDFALAEEVGARRVAVIRNGADPPHPPQKSDGLHLLTIGSHVRSKGHRDFISLTRELHRQLGAIGTVLAPRRIGFDAIRGCQLRCTIEALTPGSPLTFVDGRTHASAEDLLARSDVFVLPSTVECSPLVVIEAMAASKPWVSYDVGNVRELAGGMVVTNPHQLEDAVRKLLSSPDLRHKLGAVGHEAWKSDHQWPQIVGEYESVFCRARETSPR